MRCIYGGGSLWGFVKFSIASVENVLNLMFSWDFFGLFESLVVILLSHPQFSGGRWGVVFWVWSHLASSRSERLKYGLQRLIISRLVQRLKVQVAVFEL